VVAGCSWGSTCALFFAETYPQRVKKIIVNAIFLARKKDAEYLTPIIPLFYPDMWDELQKIAGKESPDKYFGKLLFSEKRSDQQKAMKYYKSLESQTSDGALSWHFKEKEYTDKEIQKFRVFMHYQMNDFFMKENQILANCEKIKDIPVQIYQDRWDPCCPMYQAYDLHKALPKSKLHLIPVFGHVHEKMFWKMYQDNLNDYR
jgi:proline iminopeptidase